MAGSGGVDVVKVLDFGLAKMTTLDGDGSGGQATSTRRIIPASWW